MSRRNTPKDAVLTAKKMEAATLMFEGKNASKVAEEMHVDEATIRRWAKSPHWVAFMATLEANAVDHTLRRMRGMVGKATMRFEDILDDRETEYGDIIRATFGLWDRLGIGPHSFEHLSNPEVPLTSKRELIERLKAAGIKPDDLKD